MVWGWRPRDLGGATGMGGNGRKEGARGEHAPLTLKTKKQGDTWWGRNDLGPCRGAASGSYKHEGLEKKGVGRNWVNQLE